MTETFETIKDLLWVKISRQTDEPNQFLVTFNFPFYEASSGEPLPKNTGLIHIPSMKTTFSCRLIDADQSHEAGTGSSPYLIDPSYRYIYLSFKGFVDGMVSKIPQVFLCSLWYNLDPLTLRTRKRVNRIDVDTKLLCSEVEFPVTIEQCFSNWLLIHFLYPLDPFEVQKILSEIFEFYRMQSPFELIRLNREYFGNKGLTVEDCDVIFYKKTEGDPIRQTRFYYIPDSLDECEGLEPRPIKFVVTLEKSEEVVKSFVNVISSCRTVTDFCHVVPFFLSMFRNGVFVHFFNLFLSESYALWFLYREVAKRGVEYPSDEHPRWDAYSDFCIILKWIEWVIERGNDPSVTE